MPCGRLNRAQSGRKGFSGKGKKGGFQRDLNPMTQATLVR